MSNATRVECPMCGRLVAFVNGATNPIGEPIMERHWRADIQAWEWCKASRNSVTVARMKRDLQGWKGESNNG